MKWTNIFSLFSAVSVNALVYLSPSALLSALSFAGGYEKVIKSSETIGAWFPFLFLAMTLGIPIWMLGLTLSILFGPDYIREHKSLESYLEKLNKGAGDASTWPTALSAAVDRWNTDVVRYAWPARFIITFLILCAFLCIFGSYLIFVASAFQFLRD